MSVNCVRCPSDSGSAVSWLWERFSSANCVNCPSESGSAVSWLPERFSDVNCVSCPSESGRVVSWLPERFSFCHCARCPSSLGEFSELLFIGCVDAVAEVKFRCARFQGFFDFLFGFEYALSFGMVMDPLLRRVLSPKQPSPKGRFVVAAWGRLNTDCAESVLHNTPGQSDA